jgi:hypothetical protein
MPSFLHLFEAITQNTGVRNPISKINWFISVGEETYCHSL